MAQAFFNGQWHDIGVIVEPCPSPDFFDEATALARAAAAKVRQPQNLTDALFGPYTCPRCCSYLHDLNDHGTGRG